MTERAQQGPDRLLAAVERIIEDHLPGGSLGVDTRSMAQAIVRHVRIAEMADKTAALAETLDNLTRRIAPRQADPPDSEARANVRGGRCG